ncbi:MAG: VUT family protein [Dehalococcoidia bacterium]|nr:VUT family protein [Dehalococcoidia bacterium]
MVFVTCLIVSNIIAVKLIEAPLFGVLVPAALIVFPLSYIFGDILTEVYGFSRARTIIWLAFACNLLAVAFFTLGQSLTPAAPFQDVQGAYERILGYTPRLLAASFIAYLIGEFANSMVLSRMKVATRGRFLWARTIGSTIIGEGLDTVVFNVIAFSGVLPAEALVQTALAAWTLKVAYEVAATPVTYAIVAFLKRAEGIDTYDTTASLSPLSL